MSQKVNICRNIITVVPNGQKSAGLRQQFNWGRLCLTRRLLPVWDHRVMETNLIEYTFTHSCPSTVLRLDFSTKASAMFTFSTMGKHGNYVMATTRLSTAW